MRLFVDFLDHILLLVGMGIVGVGTLAWWVGTPICRYVALVSKADTDEGSESLARHLANRTGGRKIDVDEVWRSFLPPARDLHQTHLQRRNQTRG